MSTNEKQPGEDIITHKHIQLKCDYVQAIPLQRNVAGGFFVSVREHVHKLFLPPCSTGGWVVHWGVPSARDKWMNEDMMHNRYLNNTVM